MRKWKVTGRRTQQVPFPHRHLGTAPLLYPKVQGAEGTYFSVKTSFPCSCQGAGVEGQP